MVGSFGNPNTTSMLGLVLQGLQSKGTPSKGRRGRPPKQQICQEGEGWGSTVSPGIRYIYTSRTRAREGKLSDAIGQNGRIA